MENELRFNDSSGQSISMNDAISAIVGFMKADTRRQYKVIIGTDSEKDFDDSADFVTAIVVHRVGNGGRYFWRRVELGKFHTLRDRILREVLISLDVAKYFLVSLRQASDMPFDFEIHVDIGENGETRSMIQEVVGLVRAHNFEPKTKPESYAASSVADRHC